MNDTKKPFCKVPFLIGFTTPDYRYRDCCAKTKKITSHQGQSFQQWWQSDEINAFRQQLMDGDSWPSECWKCQVSEQEQGSSFRTAVNQWPQTNYDHPAGWNIMFGNTCNLGCWICGEESSSVIFQHKKRAGLIQGEDTTQQQFKQSWPQLKTEILKSYSYHDTVTLTILGGEPLYNADVINFMSELIKLGLAHRTRLEFHTNGTVFPDKIFSNGGSKVWQHVCIFISLDAVGPYAEWLRYGCSWPKVDRVVDQLIESCDYVEIQCTLSVLNISQLTALDEYAKSKQVRLSIATMSRPEFMALKHWDQNLEKLAINHHDAKWQGYYDIIGTDVRAGTSEQLSAYIKRFHGVRKPLHEFDANMARVTGW